MKLWAGRFSKEADKKTNDFNSSIATDSRMYVEDINGSIGHATMLGAQGIISEEDCRIITSELAKIRDEITSGEIKIDPDAEDIHTFIEQTLTQRVGAPGKRLHTARSRNDQVATDVRMYLKKECKELSSQLEELVSVLEKKKEEYKMMVMPGYTHLQRAQPITLGYHFGAYIEMFKRDLGRLSDAVKRMDVSPLGSGALAGTTYPIDRAMSAKLLGFEGGYTKNTLDIMPQKKNPDLAELIRGKAGRVFGDLNALLTMMKGLPLAYNKDMQEDKDLTFEAIDTVKMCLTAFIPMIDTMTALPENMRKAAAGGFINATDCADYLVGKGLPFRDAYKATGEIVVFCIKNGYTLETLPLEEYKKICELFDEGVYDAINLETCVRRRGLFDI